MKWRERIELNPRVMLGKPVIRGTRITVELILRKMSEGASEAVLVDAHRVLQPQDVRAALGFAAEVVAGAKTIPEPRSTA